MTYQPYDKDALLSHLATEVKALNSECIDLAMMLRTCAWALRRGASPDLGERALELLKRCGRLGANGTEEGKHGPQD